jgi:hypothetical protein
LRLAAWVLVEAPTDVGRYVPGRGAPVDGAAKNDIRPVRVAQGREPAIPFAMLLSERSRSSLVSSRINDRIGSEPRTCGYCAASGVEKIRLTAVAATTRVIWPAPGFMGLPG